MWLGAITVEHSMVGSKPRELGAWSGVHNAHLAPLGISVGVGVKGRVGPWSSKMILVGCFSLIGPPRVM